MFLVIGNFGDNVTAFCGQSQRTRNVYRGLSKYTNETVKKINTANKGLRLYFHMVFQIIFAKSVIILPGESSVLQLLRILSLMNCIKKSNYVVIGGWLPAYIEKNPGIIGYLQKLKSILVQTESMVQKLLDFDINNVCWFPNFRIYEEPFVIPEKKDRNNKFKYVYYARVAESKGIELLISAFKILNKKEDKMMELDIYGSVLEDYNDRFQSLIKDNAQIQYKGILENNHLVTLSKYDLLVFPTHYDGEGFPGTILESILSGVPILASDWKYNKEIINKYQVGVLHNPYSVDDLATKMGMMLEDEGMIASLRNNCIKASEQLKPSKIMQTLIDKL